MTSPQLHPDVVHLAFLLGTWRGKGAGEYPTIESFEYFEEAAFGHVGKPFLAYTQKTRHAETDLPLHAEAGYIRPVGLDRIELVLVQPSGIVEMHEGTVDGAVIEFASTTVQTTATAKSVEASTRSLAVEGSAMTYKVQMAAVGQPLQHHLAATLKRAQN